MSQRWCTSQLQQINAQIVRITTITPVHGQRRLSGPQNRDA